MKREDSGGDDRSRRAVGDRHRGWPCAGHYSRVFVGLCEGWHSAAGSRPEAEDVLAEIDRVLATDRFSIPGSLFDEVSEAYALRKVTA